MCRDLNARGVTLLEADNGVYFAVPSSWPALRRRALPTYDFSSRVRLTKTPEQYREYRESRLEHSYEAMLSSGRPSWTIGERVRV